MTKKGNLAVSDVTLDIAVASSRERGTWSVEVDRQELREVLEVGIGREDRTPTPRGDGADEEISVRSLDSLRATSIEVGGGLFVVLRLELDVGKGPQVVAQSLVLSLV